MGSAPNSNDSQAVEVLTKLRISLHAQQRVKRSDVERFFHKVAEGANVLNTYEIKGPTIGSAFTVVFTGEHASAAARAKQALGSLRKSDGVWVGVFVPSPRGSEADIRAYISAERTAEQRLREFHWRSLRKALAAVSDAGWQYELRDKVALHTFHPVVQAAFDFRPKEYGLAWLTTPTAMAVLGLADRARVAAEHSSLVDRGPQRG